jgi:hypothetical protein
MSVKTSEQRALTAKSYLGQHPTTDEELYQQFKAFRAFLKESDDKADKLRLG